MFKTRECGCKGIRTCIACEKQFGAWKLISDFLTEEEKKKSYVFCPYCELLWPGSDFNEWKRHPNHDGTSIKLPGIKLYLDFITAEEEESLLADIDSIPWDPSQSGRCKQNYGPKCNFKKRKATTTNFNGFPKCTKFIQDRFESIELMKGFQTAEECSLEYVPDKGSSIDPHIDDCWIWGERIPTLSMSSDSCLTLTKFGGPPEKYNLKDAVTYPRVITENNSLETDENWRSFYSEENHTVTSAVTKSALDSLSTDGPIVRIPMPRRSLILLYGELRYLWRHAILRGDIKERRVCITYRELTPTFLKYGPLSDIGKQIIEKCKLYLN